MSTNQSLDGYNPSSRPIAPSVRVTDILIRGGGGTITFSDGVTVEYVFGFRPDSSIPSGGIFDVTLTDDRAARVYQNVVSQNVCDMVDWILQCSDLNRRVSLLELNAGLASEFEFEAADWTNGTRNVIQIPDLGPLVPGQIGPHGLGTDRVYHITVWKDDGSPVLVGVEIEYEVNVSTGLISLIKTGRGTPFGGRVIIS